MTYWTRRALLAGVAALALTLGAPAVLRAQGNGNGAAPGGRRGGGRQMMLSPGVIDRLGLTADQKAKEQKARGEMTAAMEGARALDRQDRRPVMQKAGQDYQTALNGILTAEQRTKLEKLVTESRQLSRSLGPIGGQLAALNPPLNADQQAKVKAIGEKYASEMQSLRGNRQAGQGGQDGNPEARTQRRALMEKVTAEVRAVLTPAQQAQLRPMGGGRRAQQ